MNPWYFLFIELFIIAFMMLGILVCIIFLFIAIAKNKPKSKIIVSLCINIAVIVGIDLFQASHSTYYAYNDRVILGQDINDIREKYGEFDEGTLKQGQQGEVSYYIYTDNGPIMPDHLKHYYRLKYDENGIVYKVYESCQKGG